ncbi:hypothetical protein ACIRBX_34175 [Kitasatospora sp. NPDC096147]|uniref:hypothetical protein n=1 Tax=Kitasatospora sp. NPDC096147 TaxID=3364093 RepID=UPI0038160918
MDTTTAPGGTRSCPDTAGHPGLDGAPVSWITPTLWEALTTLAVHLDPSAVIEPDLAACQALRLVLAAAYDTGEPGEPRGQLYVTPAVAQLGHRPVWIHRSAPGGPLTARFPTDPWPD